MLLWSGFGLAVDGTRDQFGLEIRLLDMERYTKQSNALLERIRRECEGFQVHLSSQMETREIGRGGWLLANTALVGSRGPSKAGDNDADR